MRNFFHPYLVTHIQSSNKNKTNKKTIYRTLTEIHIKILLVREEFSFYFFFLFLGHATVSGRLLASQKEMHKKYGSAKKNHENEDVKSFRPALKCIIILRLSLGHTHIFFS